jgi:hypothetical protein
VKPYKVKSNLALSDFEGREDEMGTELFSWVRSELEKPQFKAAVDALTALLPELQPNPQAVVQPLSSAYNSG